MKKTTPAIKWTVKNPMSILSCYKVEANGRAYWTDLKNALVWTTDQAPGLYTQLNTPETRTADKYPSIDVTESQKYRYSMDIDDETRATVKTLAPFVSDDETRYYMTGIYLDTEKGAMVATDGRRLSIATTVKFMAKPGPGVIIPLSSQFLECLKYAQALHIEENGKGIKLSGEGWTSYHTAIEGQFPNYQRVIPALKDCPKTFTAPTLAEIKEAQKVLRYYRSHAIMRTYLTPSGRFVADTGESAGGYLQCGTLTTPPEDAMAVNANFLAEVAGLTLHYSDPRKAIITDPRGPHKIVSVIMPMEPDNGQDDAARIEEALSPKAPETKQPEEVKAATAIVANPEGPAVMPEAMEEGGESKREGEGGQQEQPDLSQSPRTWNGVRFIWTCLMLNYKGNQYDQTRRNRSHLRSYRLL